MEVLVLPIDYRIDAERNLVLTVASGTLTDDDVIRMKRRLARDPAFKPGMCELSDVRGIERLAVTPNGIREMVAQDAENDGSRHRLALVLSEDLAYGMARMYQSLSELNTDMVGVFRDLDEAISWLESR